MGLKAVQDRFWTGLIKMKTRPILDQFYKNNNMLVLDQYYKKRDRFGFYKIILHPFWGFGPFLQKIRPVSNQFYKKQDWVWTVFFSKSLVGGWVGGWVLKPFKDCLQQSINLIIDDLLGSI